jgi:tetratricopeptide (TPR) repeat protein
MPEAEVGELLVSLGGRAISADFARAIYRKTEGNPFFIEEMLRHLADEGVIRREAGGWVGAQTLAALGVPEGVRALIGHRLSRLSEGCRQILTIGAVIGRDFSLGAAAEVSGRSQAEILEILEEAVVSSLLVKPPAGGPDRYSFSHALIRESLYEELGPVQRASLHRQAGQGLERLYDTNVEPHVAELARHFFEAMHDGDASKAIDYSIRAAERANRLLAYEEAARHYEQALQALALERPHDPARECRLLLALAHTIWSAGETNTARQTVLRAAEVARQAGDAQLLGAAALAAGGRYPGLQIGILDGSLVALLEEAFASLQGSDAPPVAEIMARLAEALTFSDASRRRELLARSAIETARRHADPVELAQVLQHAHLPLWRPDNVEERLAMSAEMLTLAEQTGEIGVTLAAMGWRLVHLMEIGDMAEVHRQLDRYGRLADDLHQPVYQYVAHLRRTLCVLLEGRFGEAEELVGQTIPLGQRAQVDTAVQAFGAQTYHIRLAQGRLAELEPAVLAMVERYPAAPVWRIGLALLYAETDRRSHARRELERLAEKQFEDLPRDLNFNCGLALLGIVTADLGDAERAALLYELLLPQAGRCVLAGGTAPLGAASLFLGMLATTLERWEDAVAHFEAALDTNARIGARPWLAQTQYRYAEMRRARSLPGDGEEAWALLERAGSISGELGMRSLEVRVRALRLRLEEAVAG